MRQVPAMMMSLRMNLNTVANVLDLELNGNNIIEIGITMIDLKKLEIVKTVSMPIFPQPRPISPDIVELTGWTDKKLEKSGINLSTAFDRIIYKYGGLNRMLIVDNKNELLPFETVVETRRHMHSWDDDDIRADWPVRMPFKGPVLNIADILKIVTNNVDRTLSLPEMLNFVGLEFNGRRHRADVDSVNIARLFIRTMQNFRTNSEV